MIFFLFLPLLITLTILCPSPSFATFLHMAWMLANKGNMGWGPRGKWDWEPRGNMGWDPRGKWEWEMSGRQEGTGSGIPKVAGSGRKRENYSTLHNILQSKRWEPTEGYGKGPPLTRNGSPLFNSPVSSSSRLPKDIFARLVSVWSKMCTNTSMKELIPRINNSQNCE